MKITCAACGVEVELPDKVGFRDTCPSCDSYLHSCVNCLHWVDSRCSEPSAERVGDPEGMNYCEWFVVSTQDAPRPGSGQAARSTQERQKEGSKEAAEEIWRKLTKK